MKFGFDFLCTLLCYPRAFNIPLQKHMMQTHTYNPIPHMPIHQRSECTLEWNNRCKSFVILPKIGLPLFKSSIYSFSEQWMSELERMSAFDNVNIWHWLEEFHCVRVIASKTIHCWHSTVRSCSSVCIWVCAVLFLSNHLFCWFFESLVLFCRNFSHTHTIRKSHNDISLFFSQKKINSFLSESPC